MAGRPGRENPSAASRDNEIISYTKDDRFGYDGMPTAVLLQDGSIVMSIEVWAESMLWIRRR